jgi:hypothetical protein
MYAEANMGHPSRTKTVIEGSTPLEKSVATSGLKLKGTVTVAYLFRNFRHHAAGCNEIITPATTTSASAAHRPTIPDKDPTSDSAGRAC